MESVSHVKVTIEGPKTEGSHDPVWSVVLEAIDDEGRTIGREISPLLANVAGEVTNAVEETIRQMIGPSYEVVTADLPDYEADEVRSEVRVRS